MHLWSLFLSNRLREPRSVHSSLAARRGNAGVKIIMKAMQSVMYLVFYLFKALQGVLEVGRPAARCLKYLECCPMRLQRVERLDCV